MQHHGVVLQVEPPLFTIEDDTSPNVFENQIIPDTKEAQETSSLLSVDELLDSVSEIFLFIQIGVLIFLEIRQT